MAYKAPLSLVLLACVTVQVGFGGYGIVLEKFAEGAHANVVSESTTGRSSGRPSLLYFTTPCRPQPKTIFSPFI